MIGLSEIYDAAFDQRQVPVMLDRLVEDFDAQAGFIAWTDTDRDAGFQAQIGNDPLWLQRYIDTYARHDILRPLLQAEPEGQCVMAHVLFDRVDVRESVFYREYLAPQGIIDNLAVNLIKRPGIVAHLALLRFAPAGPFAAADCERLTALVPHLRRAVYIQSHIVRAADHAATIQAVGGATGAGLLLSEDRRVIEIDPSLATLLHIHRGDMLGDTIFGRAVAAAIDRDAPVAVELPAGAEPIALLCEARVMAQHRFGDLAAGPSPTHAIHITRLDQPRSIAFEAMAELYRLTPTELRVLRDSVEQSDLTGIGGRLGMGPATSRTHLHRIYEKTATRSFADLSNLANRFGIVGKVNR